MTATGAIAEPQASFLMVVPPGWSRLPVREAEAISLAARIDEIVAEALPADLPRDSAEPWRAELRKRLTTTATEAREAGATAIYLPTRAIDGFSAPASLIESEVDDEGTVSTADVLAELMRDPAADASRHEVDGAAAVRTDRTVAGAKPEGDLPEVTTRQVVYTIDVPHREGRWVVLSYSVIFAENTSRDLSDALVLLFDAMMSTFRWVDVPGVEPSDLELRLDEISRLAQQTTAPATD